jgi:hypothetical protein
MKILELFLKSETVIRLIQELQFVLSLCVCLVREGAIRSCFYGLFHLIGGGESRGDNFEIIYEVLR